MTPLISLEEAKAGLPIREGNTSFDARITTLIASASQQIETACRRSFGKQQYSEIMHVQGGYSVGLDLFGHGSNDSGVIERADPSPFTLSNYPVDTAQPVEVYYDPQRRFGPDTLIDPSLVTVVADRKALVYVNALMRRSQDSVKIVYTAGYDIAAGELPGDIKQAVTLQVQFQFKKFEYGNVGKTTDESAGGDKPVRWEIAGGLLPDVVALVAPYRRVLRGRG